MTEHVVSPRVYYVVFVALIALTVLTIVLASVELGPWHTPVGLLIAAVKATLVALFFMHVLYAGRLTWMLLGVGLFWLLILIGLTMTDYVARDLLAY
jgi:cytochrome c oxidase subunit IV